MSGTVRLAALACALLVPLGAPVEAKDSAPEPYELIRTLRIVQDRMARGDAGAQTSQRGQLDYIEEHLASVDPAKWQDPRNARAAITFVLSGGRPSVLRNLLGAGVKVGVDDKLIKGAVAYGEGRLGEAADLLTGIDPRSLDPSIAGHVALVQAELVARKQPLKALVFLDEARLLAPGTLVEEAALRRQATILAAAGSRERFEAMALQYLRRFPKSVYAPGFRRQLASEIVAGKSADETGLLARLAAAVATLDRADRREVFLAIASEGTLKGRIALVRSAAGHAAPFADAGSAEAAALQLYEGAALIVTDDYERGLSILEGIDRSALGRDDAELLDAALSVADLVRRPPQGAALPPPGEDAGSKAVEMARKAILAVDGVLSGGTK